MKPLQLVADRHGVTHITVSSPAIIGATPESRIVLCGAAAYAESHDPLPEVECPDCLFASQLYWGLPTWSQEAVAT